MESRFKAILLIGLCLLVQAISVYPHHHHEDALCTGHDMKAAFPAGSPRPCTDGCITHFSLTLPTADISVALQKTVRHQKDAATPDQTVCAVQTLHAGRGKRQERHSAFYTSPPAGGTALRAPPCLFPSHSEE